LGSPIVADLVRQNLELHILDKLLFIPSFYVRYVDDVALAARYTLFDELLSKFNSFHSRFKFTMETEGMKLNFLELTIIIYKDGWMIFNWYQKFTFSSRFFNYYSHLTFYTQKKV